MPTTSGARCSTRATAAGRTHTISRATMVNASLACCGPPREAANAKPLPPGRLRLVTSPSLTGSLAAPNTIGIEVVAALAASAAVPLPGATITRTPRRTRSGRQLAYWPRPAELERHVLPLLITALSEALANCGHLLDPFSSRTGMLCPSVRRAGRPVQTAISITS